MADIQCSACGTLSATPRAHQNHICRPIEPIRVAPPVGAPDPGRGSRTPRTPVWDGYSGAQDRVRDNQERWKERVGNRMANIVLCDRCGAIATDKVAGGMELSIRPDKEPEFYGLCPGCIRELYQWLKSDMENRPMIAYKTAFDPEEVPDPVTNPAETTERAILDGD
jgi:hypothetical protein